MVSRFITKPVMMPKFRRFRRGKTFWCEDAKSGRQQSLGTKNKGDATCLLHGRNEAHAVPFAYLRPLLEPPGRTFRTRTEQIDPFPADRMASLNPFYRLAFSRIKMESPSGRPQIESTRLLETRLVAMGRILHSP